MNAEKKEQTVAVKIDSNGTAEASVSDGKTTGRATATSLEDAVAEAEKRSKKNPEKGG